MQLDEVVERTFFIRTEQGCGTAAAVQINQADYLLTAKHLVATPSGQIEPNDHVFLYNDQGEKCSTQIALAHIPSGEPNEGGVDVALLKPASPLAIDDVPLVRPAVPLGVGEDLVAVSAENRESFGTAFGLVIRTGKLARLVKREHRIGASGEFLVEMLAYPGFSGSPLLRRSDDGECEIIGVASRWSYRNISALGYSVHTGVIGCFTVEHAFNLTASSVTNRRNR